MVRLRVGQGTLISFARSVICKFSTVFAVQVLAKSPAPGPLNSSGTSTVMGAKPLKPLLAFYSMPDGSVGFGAGARRILNKS